MAPTKSNIPDSPDSKSSEEPSTPKSDNVINPQSPTARVVRERLSGSNAPKNVEKTTKETKESEIADETVVADPTDTHQLFKKKHYKQKGSIKAQGTKLSEQLQNELLALHIHKTTGLRDDLKRTKSTSVKGTVVKSPIRSIKRAQSRKAKRSQSVKSRKSP